MKRTTPMCCLLITLLLAGLSGCTDPCVSRCEEGKDEGCVPEERDCAASCEDVREEEVEIRDDARRAGCVSEFQALVDCDDERMACESGDCGSETVGFGACMAEYCLANPTSTACR